MQNFPHLQAALSRLPRLPYEQWTNLISALTNEFGAENAQSILFSSGFRDERRGETAYKARKAKRNIHFGTLVHILRAYGINATNVIREMQEQRGAPTYAAPRRIETQQRPQSRRERAFIAFVNSEHEARRVHYQFTEKHSFNEAFQRVLEENPNAEYKRLYRVMTSRQAVDKQILCGMAEFQSSFEHEVLDLDGLISHIRQGFAFAPSVWRGGRKSEHFFGGELVCVDIDSGLTWEEALAMDATATALFAYTTPSHTPEAHRFRIVFDLSGFERNAEYYQAIVRATIARYNADAACSDVCRFFFGSTNATVWKGGAQ